MSGFQHHTLIKIGSERNFGLVFGAIFLIIGIYPLLYNQEIYYWSCFISIFFFFLSIFFPKTLIIPNKLWFKFGLLLGKFVSPIVMSMIFFLTITPMGLVIKLLRKDLINQKINKKAKSYWIKRKEDLGSMKNQF